MNRKTLIRTSIALLLLGVAARFGWIAMTSVSSDDRAQSPDKRYVAKLSNKLCEGFWGGTHDYHGFTIETREGRRVRHIVMEESLIGWPDKCSIEWAADSSSVTLAFTDTEAQLPTTRLIVTVSP